MKAALAVFVWVTLSLFSVAAAVQIDSNVDCMEMNVNNWIPRAEHNYIYNVKKEKHGFQNDYL